VLAFFKDVFGYHSLDGKGMKVVSSVHFGENYAGAGWYSNPEGTIKQMLYGDGNNEILGRFTKALDVIAHAIMVRPSPGSSSCFGRLLSPPFFFHSFLSFSPFFLSSFSPFFQYRMSLTR